MSGGQGRHFSSTNSLPTGDLQASYSREHESGSRPLGVIFNSSPSASLTGGYGAEVPEPINYFTDTVKVMAERAAEKWAVQIGYLGSYFQNDTGTLLLDNPFRTTDCVAPDGCTPATQGPATGRVDLYPDNKANYATFAGSFALPIKAAIAGQYQCWMAAAE